MQGIQRKSAQPNGFVSAPPSGHNRAAIIPHAVAKRFGQPWQLPSSRQPESQCEQCQAGKPSRCETQTQSAQISTTHTVAAKKPPLLQLHGARAPDGYRIVSAAERSKTRASRGRKGNRENTPWKIDPEGTDQLKTFNGEIGGYKWLTASATNSMSKDLTLWQAILSHAEKCATPTAKKLLQDIHG